ncbi:MAG TPA: DnaJ domain-containing protein [Myxococcota bacterium]|nr:DnaJ domain-containing protein [Myxococcota bacterium]
MGSNDGGSREQERIPRLAPDLDPEVLELTPVEGFLLSRIDGSTSWKTLCHIGGLAPHEVDRALERFEAKGVIVVERPGGARAAAAAGRAEPQAKADAAKSIVPAGSVDARLGISLELQRRILEFESGLERPYHDLLGVERNADAKEIKRAYFRLSREYHPDRYFRRDLGHFGARLERIFRKVAEAYELLSDPNTRAEIERSLASGPAPSGGEYRHTVPGKAERIGPEPAPPRGQRVPGRMENLERLRNRFRIPPKLLAERRIRARQLFQAARVSAHEGRYLEAAASMRLAIAFDPWEKEFKSGFADIQAQVHAARAEELLKRAGDAVAQGEALHLLEEALLYRPCHVETLRRAIALSIEVRELEKAREYAEQLVEIAPDVAAHHARLAGVLRRQGKRAQASAALENGARIDAKDPEIKAERLNLHRSRARSGGAA